MQTSLLTPILNYKKIKSLIRIVSLLSCLITMNKKCLLVGGCLGSAEDKVESDLRVETTRNVSALLMILELILRGQ